jgi:hypothetical protein
MASLRLRWSEHEARKPYARPFMVTFVGDGGEPVGSLALSGSDLLYLRQFGAAVAALSGEIFALDTVDSAADPQRAWLDVLTSLLPATGDVHVSPRSTFDHDSGRVFGFRAECAAGGTALVDAATLFEYQDFQAALAHQAGKLLRITGVEEIEDPAPRRRAWLSWLRDAVARPAADEAMAGEWPWR